MACWKRLQEASSSSRAVLMCQRWIGEALLLLLGRVEPEQQTDLLLLTLLWREARCCSTLLLAFVEKEQIC